MKIKYLIVDDEHVAHDIIKGYCDLLPNMDLQKNCYDAIEALDYLNANKVDLIFLDLNMPKLKGFDFLKTLSAPPKVIVTTAYSEFALEGYELNVADYLLKPFSFERFLKAVNKATSSFELKSSVAEPNITQKPTTIFLRADKKYIQVNVEDVLYLESVGNYVNVVLKQEMITVREKISDLLESLPGDSFIQTHKSFAVSIQHIHSIEGNRIFIGDHTVPIGKVYKMNVDQLLKRPNS